MTKTQTAPTIQLDTVQHEGFVASRATTPHVNLTRITPEDGKSHTSVYVHNVVRVTREPNRATNGETLTITTTEGEQVTIILFTASQS